MIKDEFGIKIKETRQSKFMSQNELASIIGIDRAQISKIEKGNINVTLETIERLANALDVPLKELMDLDANYKVRPFVKWAGGKTQIIAKLKDLMPNHYNAYYEPFIGGGALFFSIKPKIAVISDTNNELICAYRCFTEKNMLTKLKDELKLHEKNNSEEYYYKVRSEDRDSNFLEKEDFQRASRMIYLNKACFNGLYRVNSKGYFNVPFGKKEKVNTFDEENFSAIHQLFTNNKIEIYNQDYQTTVKNAKNGDFVYFDPPYDVYPDTTGFVDYGKDGFGKDEQIRLRDCFKKLSEKGVKVMLSNHNTPFINELYQGFNINIIDAKRMINSNASGRGAVQEVIITSY